MDVKSLSEYELREKLDAFYTFTAQCGDALFNDEGKQQFYALRGEFLRRKLTPNVKQYVTKQFYDISLNSVMKASKDIGVRLVSYKGYDPNDFPFNKEEMKGCNECTFYVEGDTFEEIGLFLDRIIEALRKYSSDVYIC